MLEEGKGRVVKGLVGGDFCEMGLKTKQGWWGGQNISWQLQKSPFEKVSSESTLIAEVFSKLTRRSGFDAEKYYT